MVSEVPSSNDVNMVTEELVSSSSPSKKNPGKVPKKIHKAEREKLKRDQLNVLFLELGNALEPAQQNSGKATIVSDATRLLRDLLSQIDGLRKENVALLSESRYVTIEKNELREEKCALEAQIKKLQSELEERNRSKSAWNLNPSQSLHNNATPQLQEDQLLLPVIDHASQGAPVAGPVFVVPLHHDHQAYSEPHPADVTSKPPSNVSRPHARYPSPSDSWPSQILAKQPKAAQQSRPSTSTSTSTSTSSSSRGD
ncbi:hypothetical protein L1049_002248 [Liquidambar formosana]|uniref:BHLH domain-containing protein n=1 Tax=Liquidambar formosana TaxID=63359 RepID=A0AAP0NFN1_LIQFO